MTNYTSTAEPSVLTNVVQGGVTSYVILYFNQAIPLMVPFFITALCLIVADLFFGICAAARRYEEGHDEKDRVKLSRAIRLTVQKIFSYLCWIIVAASLAVSFQVSWLNPATMTIIIGNEAISIIGNYFYGVHGKKITGVQDFCLKLVGKKMNVDTSDIHIEDAEK